MIVLPRLRWLQSSSVSSIIGGYLNITTVSAYDRRGNVASLNLGLVVNLIVDSVVRLFALLAQE